MSDQRFVSPLVLHVPHSSTIIPPELRATFLLDDAELGEEIRKMTDLYTDELFDVKSGCVVRFPVSRLVVDPERFRDDAEEVMAARGMGALYTSTSSLGCLRDRPDPHAREELLARFYDPHHQALEAAVDAALAANGRAVVIDCHSFPSQPRPYEIEQDPDRPDLCIGTDSFHTPSDLVERVQGAAERAGFSVEIDRPFAGALVPAKHYRQRRSVFAVMLEVNRRLYMDEETGERLASFGTIRGKLAGLVSEIEAWQCEGFSERDRDEG